MVKQKSAVSENPITVKMRGLAPLAMAARVTAMVKAVQIAPGMMLSPDISASHPSSIWAKRG